MAAMAVSGDHLKSVAIRELRAILIKLAKGETAMFIDIWRTNKRFCKAQQAVELTLGPLAPAFFAKLEKNQSKLEERKALLKERKKQRDDQAEDERRELEQEFRAHEAEAAGALKLQAASGSFSASQQEILSRQASVKYAPEIIVMDCSEDEEEEGGQAAPPRAPPLHKPYLTTTVCQRCALDVTVCGCAHVVTVCQRCALDVTVCGCGMSQ